MSENSWDTFLNESEPLKTTEDIAAYLSVAISQQDDAVLVHALNVIIQASGMSQIAKDSGISREALYKALRSDASPRFDTINRVCHALGVKLVVQPINAH